MTLTFCGAAREVTGSCYLLDTGSQRILIDCGLFQGSRLAEDKNYDSFPFDPQTIDVLLITHAHLDHVGRIPKLVREGFRGKIIATHPTVRLAQLILEDSQHVLAMEAEHHGHQPLYSESDVARMANLFSPVSYREEITACPGVSAEFFDAGHIIGSSMIRVTVNGVQIVFSGDLGNNPVPLLNRTDTIGSADIVVMESTYGGRVHEDVATRSLILQSAIYETVTMKGVLMIPAFAMERTQELLYELNTLVNNKDIPSVPIYLDSPLAIRATRVFKEFPEYLDEESRVKMTNGDDVFQFPGLHMTLLAAQSKEIYDMRAPKIVIAGSGMAQGGRIVHHIENYISFFANQYLIIGYQVQGSLGRRLLDGEKHITLHGKRLDVKAKVRAIGGYSAHADQPMLLEWIGAFDQQRLKKIFITHGEESQALGLQSLMTERFQKEVIVPSLEESINV